MDIRNLGAYFASLPPAAATKPDESSQAEANAKIVAERSCASCHTDTFAGTKGTARIAEQHKDYLSKRYMTTNPAQDRAAASFAMASVAYSFSDEEISALAHYLAHFSCWRGHSAERYAHVGGTAVSNRR